MQSSGFQNQVFSERILLWSRDISNARTLDLANVKQVFREEPRALGQLLLRDKLGSGSQPTGLRMITWRYRQHRAQSRVPALS